jgi:hypothetical protein
MRHIGPGIGGRIMRYRRCVAVLVSLAALSVIAPAAQADPPAGAGAGKVAPFKSVGGVSAEEVLIASFTPFYTGEPVDPCTRLADGKILVPQDGSTCTVKPGTQVIVEGPGVSCSDAEPPPFFAETADGQRACALANLRGPEGVLRIMVSVDGGPPQNVLSDRFLTITDQFGVLSQPGNPFGARPGPTTLVAAGYFGVLRGLPPGRHTFVVSQLAFGVSDTFSYTVNVVPGAGHGDNDD